MPISIDVACFVFKSCCCYFFRCDFQLFQCKFFAIVLSARLAFNTSSIVFHAEPLYSITKFKWSSLLANFSNNYLQIDAFKSNGKGLTFSQTTFFIEFFFVLKGFNLIIFCKQLLSPGNRPNKSFFRHCFSLFFSLSLSLSFPLSWFIGRWTPNHCQKLSCVEYFF